MYKRLYRNSYLILLDLLLVYLLPMHCCCIIQKVKIDNDVLSSHLTTTTKKQTAYWQQNWIPQYHHVEISGTDYMYLMIKLGPELVVHGRSKICCSWRILWISSVVIFIVDDILCKLGFEFCCTRATIASMLNTDFSLVESWIVSQIIWYLWCSFRKIRTERLWRFRAEMLTLYAKRLIKL